MSVSEFLPVFEALGNETRLRVFEFIYCSGSAGARPKELIDKFGFDSGTLDFHLKKLIAVKLITQKIGCRRGVYCVGENIPVELIHLFNSALPDANLSDRLPRLVDGKEMQHLH
jgi:ArsR family transcriptional regulator